jgi:hypothetical protein
MKKKALLVALSLLLLSVMLFPSICQAGSTDVVIQVGDWFKYQARVTKWISDDPFLPDGYFGPLSLADNQTNWIMYTVTAITPVNEPVANSKNITFTITYNWQNGSVTTGTMVETVSTANQDLFMIGADMNAPAKVSDPYSFFGFFDYPERDITRTFDYANPTATRATNELNYSVNIFGSDYNYTMWWDKATGIRVYYENWGNVAAFFTAAYEYTVVYKLVDSNIANLSYIPEMYTPIMLLLMLGASTISIVLYRRKKLRI